MEELLANNEIEDVRWLCSLSESEIDMVISLKMMAIRRAQVIGHEELASKFDLKTLRAIALVLMEYLKGNVQNLSHFQDSAPHNSFLDACSLLHCKVGDLLSIEGIKTCLGLDGKKKSTAKRPREEVAD